MNNQTRLGFFVIAASLGFFAHINDCHAKEQSKNATLTVRSANYKAQPETAESALGRSVIDKNGCLQCHSIENKGGCLAPPYDGIGAHRSKEFILSRITNTEEAKKEFARLYPNGELWVHPRISHHEAKAVADYLLTLPEPKNGFRVGAHKVVSTDQKHKETAGAESESANAKTLAEGKALFNEHGCVACHSIGNIGGHFAPRLDGLGNRHDLKFIEDRINSTEFLSDNGYEYSERGTMMPPTNLTEAQVHKISAFLMSLPESK